MGQTCDVLSRGDQANIEQANHLEEILTNSRASESDSRNPWTVKIPIGSLTESDIRAGLVTTLESLNLNTHGV